MFHPIPRSSSLALSIIFPTLPNNNGPGTNVSAVFSYIFLGCLRCFSNNIPQRKQGFRSCIAFYSLDPAKVHRWCFRVSRSPPVTDMLITSPEILRSTPWRAHPGETQTCRTTQERPQGHEGDTRTPACELSFSSHHIFWDLKYCLTSHRDEGLKSTLEPFTQKPTCSSTAVLWLGHAFLACRKPAFRTRFGIVTA